MGLTFEQKFYNLPDLLVITIPGIQDYVYAIIEDTPENRELLMNDIEFRRGNKVINFVNSDDMDMKIKEGYKLLDLIKSKI